MFTAKNIFRSLALTSAFFASATFAQSSIQDETRFESRQEDIQSAQTIFADPPAIPECPIKYNCYYHLVLSDGRIMDCNADGTSAADACERSGAACRFYASLAYGPSAHCIPVSVTCIDQMN
jgi:hypothetical protein